MDRKGGNRGRVVNLRAVKPKSDRLHAEGPAQEIVGVSLGDRMVFSEQAEVWTVKGHLRDGAIARENIGELSFVMIPGNSEPATAIIGFIAPSEPYVLGIGEDSLWPQIRSIIVQLGYDLDGFYASLAIAGRYAYFEEFRRDR
jgi:hypothetical protein